MPQRSQSRMAANRGYRPPITSILPDTASIAAAGAVNRVIATMSVVGGVIPITYTVTDAAGLNLNVLNNTLRTNLNPVGTAGSKAVVVKATDGVGQTKSETITVTVT